MSGLDPEALEGLGPGAAAEVELLLAAYGSDVTRIVISPPASSTSSSSCSNQPGPSQHSASCTVVQVSLGVLGTYVRLSIPHDFPTSRIAFSVDGDGLAGAERRALLRDLVAWEAAEIEMEAQTPSSPLPPHDGLLSLEQLEGGGLGLEQVDDDYVMDDDDGADAIADPDPGLSHSTSYHDPAQQHHPGCLEICQRVLDGARSVEEERAQQRSPHGRFNGSGNSSSNSPYARGGGAVLLPRTVVLARMVIYFHHIVSPTKRRCLVDWALALGLGGFSRPGHPGIVLVEGEREAAMQYVAGVQRLRWKHMVVRGEEMEEIDLSAIAATAHSGGECAPILSSRDAEALITRAIDGRRRLPAAFLGELSTMAEAGAVSAAAGLRDLFLTAMKKY